MNIHDSERMGEILHHHGWDETSLPEQADVVILNTCSVREKAEHKLRSEVGRWVAYKKERPHMILVVTGCVAQQEGERLLKKFPGIDILVGPDNLPELPLLLEQQAGGAPPIARTIFDVDQPHFLSAQPLPGQAPVSAFVTTMKGCDERCSFCIVPYTRGPERYRPARDILAEIQRLVEAGTKEIVLLGQTVDSYRDPALPPPASEDPDESQFPVLLRLIIREVPALLRLRYTSPHPRHATASLAQAHAELEPLAEHIHLPVQSGSNRILKRMIRRYTREEYIERAQRLLRARPGLTLSTDVIVGFPGETEEDFAQTLSLVQEIGFVSLFGFQYSVRPYTPARKLSDDVPLEVKQERLTRLFEIAEAQTHAHMRSLVPSQQQVLFEGPSKYRNEDATEQWFQGHTKRNEWVHVPCLRPHDPTGQLLTVTVTHANRHSLQGQFAQNVVSQLPVTSSVLSEPSLRRSLPVVA